jgi:Bacteriophage HK97-gp10, putative tail-component
MSIQQLARLPDDLKRDISKVMQQVSVGVPNAVRPITPIDTGHLRRSWRGRHSKFAVQIRNTAFYSDWIENGTKRMRARPMISPMLPLIEAEIERAIVTGTDWYLPGSAFSDPADQLKRTYRSKYGSYGSHVGFSG